MSKWKFDDEIRREFKPMFEEWLTILERMSSEDVNKFSREELGMQLSGIGINPWQTIKLFEELGFKENSEISTNGWQMDFCVTMKASEGHKFCGEYDEITISGCGMTFTLDVWVGDLDF